MPRIEKHTRTIALAGLCASMCLTPVGAKASDAQQDIMRLTAPAQDRETISRRPHIRVAVDVPIEPETLRVLLDGMDITNLVEHSGSELTYVPRQVLPGGEHVLQVQVRSRDGLDLMRELRFSTRHSSGFTQLSSSLRFGIEAEALAARRDTEQPEQSYRMQGDIAYALQAARGPFEIGLDTNLWYLNQKLEVFPPQNEGLDLASYRLRGAAHGEHYALAADLGDLQITGTHHTLGTLARRGASLGLDYRNFSLGGFSVSSRQLFGFRDGLGVGTDPRRNVYGFTTGLGFFDDRLRLRALHARGGEPGSSFGLFTAQGGTEGRVTGYVLTARPAPSIEIEAEYDRSDFDGNVMDAIGSRNDEAWALRLSGQRRAFNFQLGYEHLGPDYAVVASPVMRDQENLVAAAGFQGARHSISANAIAQHDNVDGDPLRPRLGNRELSVDYGYVAGEHWLLGAGYRDSRVTSSHEPVGFSEQDVRTTGLTGRAQFWRHPLRVGLELSLSDQDDQFIDANDSRVLTASFSPAWQTERFSIVPLYSHNTTKYLGTGVELDQRNLSLMLNGQLADQRFGYGLALTYYDQQTSDGSLDSNARNAELRLSYVIRRGLDQSPRATVNIRTAYLDRRDDVFGFDSKDWTVWLTMVFNPRFVF